MIARVRNRGGWISGAEGCMFLAVLLFALLLVGLLILVYVRFDERPRSTPAPTMSSLELMLPERT
jgi:hypothetical protein